MTSKLQMVITFATVVRLRPIIYQNAHNSENNLDKGIWCMVLLPKSSSNCLISCSKIKHPLSLFFFKISATFFFDTKCERHKKQEQKCAKNKSKNETKTKTRTQQDANKKTNNWTRTKHEPGQITKKNNRIG